MNGKFVNKWIEYAMSTHVGWRHLDLLFVMLTAESTWKLLNASKACGQNEWRQQPVQSMYIKISKERRKMSKERQFNIALVLQRRHPIPNKRS